MFDIPPSLKEGDSLVRPPMPERGASEKRLTSALPPLKTRQEETRSNSAPNERNYTQNTAADIPHLKEGALSGVLVIHQMSLIPGQSIKCLRQ